MFNPKVEVECHNVSSVTFSCIVCWLEITGIGTF